MNGKRLPASLCLIAGLFAAACGSAGGDPGAQSTSPDSDSEVTDDPTELPSDAAGNLPNLTTHSTDEPDPEPEPEPADCEVHTLSACVTDALDELSNCLVAGHGGAFPVDTSRCELAEAEAVVTFSQAVPRWGTAFALNFVLDVAGQTCASYAERGAPTGPTAQIELVTAQHTVTLDTADDLQRNLTCNGVSVSFRQSNLSSCREPKPMPTPELMDQTLDGTYQVFPMLQSNRCIFNCRFPTQGL